MTKVELFECIRKAHFIEKLSQRAIAKRYCIHRRQIKQAIASAVPPKRKESESSTVVLTSAIKLIIDQWLSDDRKAPKKQRHTSQRIYTRLVTEWGYTGSLPTIRRHVGARRRELGIKQEVFIPLLHLAGEEAEVDWYEATVNFLSGGDKVFIFQMRACYSGREFHCAYPRQTQQAFLEAHVAAFNYFGGVFKKVRYDNLTSAVKKILAKREREESERFTLLRSHYLFDAIFCRPGKVGSHEKGGVEGGVGRFRRQHLVPVPTFSNYKALNNYLLTCCQEDDKRIIIGKNQPIEQDWREEIAHLRPLPKLNLDLDEVLVARVNQKSLVSVNGNFYSVPIRHCGQRVEVRLSTLSISFYHQGKAVATHARSYQKHQVFAELDHYLELLKIKPLALRQALPLHQYKQKGRWPPIYDDYWQLLIDKHGYAEGTRQLIELLILHRTIPQEDIVAAIALAKQSGYLSVDAVVYFIKNAETKTITALPKSPESVYSPNELYVYDHLISPGVH